MRVRSQSDAYQDRDPGSGPKVRLLTLDNMDHRTHAARLAHALIEEIETDLGGSENLSTGTRQIVKRAAVLGAYVENAEVRWLSGLEIDTAEYLMAVNVQRRLLVTLGLDRRSKDITRLSDLLRADQEEQRQHRRDQTVSSDTS